MTEATRRMMTEAGHLVDADPGLMVPRAVVEGLLEVEPIYQWTDGMGEPRDYECVYCEATAHPWGGAVTVPHTPDCPWAQLRAVAGGGVMIPPIEIQGEWAGETAPPRTSCQHCGGPLNERHECPPCDIPREGESDMVTVLCPECREELRVPRFESGVRECRHCGTMVMAEHDCIYDEESGDEWCADYGVRATKDSAITP